MIQDSDQIQQPIQPTHIDDIGTRRFKENRIVSVVLENSSLSLNDIAIRNFSQTDREQFAQLIGYSVSGFSDLSYASTQTIEAVDRMIENPELTDKDARILFLEQQLKHLTDSIRDLATAAFQIHPDDLIL